MWPAQSSCTRRSVPAVGYTLMGLDACSAFIGNAPGFCWLWSGTVIELLDRLGLSKSCLMCYLLVM